MFLRTAGTAIILTLSTYSAQAATATLASLISGGTLVEGDVIFDGFAFQDNSDVPTYPLDTEIDPAEVNISTSAAATFVTLTATFDPSIALSGADGFFDFWLDFTASVIAPSTRMIASVDITGDIFHTGDDGDAEVVYELGGFDAPSSPVLEIYSAAGFGTQTSDSAAPLAAPVSSLLMESASEGATSGISTAGYSTYSLTFNLVGDPPVTPVPLPAGLPLLLAGIGGLALVRRRQSKA